MSYEIAKKSVNKGKSGEREFIRTVYRLTNGKIKLNRNLQQCRDGGDDLLGIDLLSFEIKRWRRISDALVRDWWLQAQRNAKKMKQTPILAYRADHQCWKIVMHPNNFFSEEDIRGCVTMGIELFCRFLIDPNWLKEYGQKD